MKILPWLLALVACMAPLLASPTNYYQAQDFLAGSDITITTNTSGFTISLTDQNLSDEESQRLIQHYARIADRRAIWTCIALSIFGAFQILNVCLVARDSKRKGDR